MRVLVVDASASIRQRLRERFTELEGIEVCEARDGARALDICASVPIDAVILDIAVGLHAELAWIEGPAASSCGLDLIPRLRALAPSARLVVLTNRSSEAHQRECLQRGAAYFFDKSREFERAVSVVSGSRS